MCRVQLSVVWDLKDRELRVYCDAGRCCRPLYIVDVPAQRLAIRRQHIQAIQRADAEHPISLTEDFFRKGLIEYIDADEVPFSFEPISAVYCIFACC